MYALSRKRINERDERPRPAGNGRELILAVVAALQLHYLPFAPPTRYRNKRFRSFARLAGFWPLQWLPIAGLASARRVFDKYTYLRGSRFRGYTERDGRVGI